MSNIRVKYSGLIAIAVGFGSILTGMLFFLIITRRLSPEELGIWALVGSILSYLLISENLISFWSIRQIARGHEVGKTAVSSSLTLSIGLIPVYLIYVTAISDSTDIDKQILMLGVLLLPVYYLSNTLNKINTAHRPQVTSYGIIIFESIKTPFALAFVVFFDLGVEGVIITVLFASLVKICVQLYFARNKLKNQLSWVVFKNWFKNSWISSYEMIPQYIRKIDAVVFVLITNSVIGLAYYHVSSVIAKIILNSRLIGQGLYPKLLAGGSSYYIKEVFTLTMYFAIPLLAISIIFSKPALFALNPLYQNMEIIVILLATYTFISIPSIIFQAVLKGIEKVDTKENTTAKDLLKSNLFTISSTRIIRNVMYLGLLIGGLILLSFESDKELVIWWGMVAIISEIPIVIFWWRKIHQHVKFPFPAKEISKYSLATIIFSLVYWLTSDFIINYKISIYEFLPGLIIQMLICVGIYFAVTYLIDKKTRNIVSKIFQEIKM
jgi:O-antigen/teichoic acid export membrane protein